MNEAKPLLQIGQTVFTHQDIILWGLGLALAILLTGLIVLWIQNNKRSENSLLIQERAHEMEKRFGEIIQAHAELTGRLQAMGQHQASQQSNMTRTLNERLDKMSHRLGQNLESTTKQTTDRLGALHERLAVIDTAQKNITELSGQMVSLQDILSNKQSRGQFGQGQMEAIIRDLLPKNSYSFQHTLSNNTRPDCIINLPNTDTVMVIDAKFPLEAFRAFSECESDADRKLASTSIRTDVSKHIKDIAEKYLIPGETQEPAIMFVPSESLFIEIHEHFDDLIQKAYRSKVFIVSPHMLMLSIQTLLNLFKDAQMREHAGLIQNEVNKMMEDVHRLHDRILDLQKHFALANSDIDKILVSSEKITKRGHKIEQLDLEEDVKIGKKAGQKTTAKKPLNGAGKIKSQKTDKKTEPSQPSLLTD